jgi:cytochrome c oxidase assembly factor 3, fungi type
MSPGLKRAREPYRIKNAIVGFGLGAFAVGVWAYSISAVKQDVFDDVDEEAKALASVSSSPSPSTSSGATSTMSASRAAMTTTIAPSSPGASGVAVSPGPLGTTNIVVSEPLPPASIPTIIQSRGVLGRWFPRLLDPQTKTLVSGAPPVDNIGKVGL